MPPESAPPQDQPDPPALAARAVRLAEIQARADEATRQVEVEEMVSTQWHKPYNTDVPWLLDEVRCLTGERDRARDVAVALEQECAEAWRQRNRLFRACEWYAVPESVIREASTPAAGGVS